MTFSTQLEAPAVGPAEPALSIRVRSTRGTW
jgi:hypothetical protein